MSRAAIASTDVAMSSSGSPAKLRLLMASLLAAVLLHTVDGSIVNLALPALKAAYPLEAEGVAWTLTSYLVFAAVATPLVGWLAGRIGRRAVLLVSIVGFTLASIACAAADGIAQLAMFRAFQGLCGAAFVPLAQAELLDSYPSERHGWAIATLGGGAMLGPVIGPTIGGLLTDAFGWRSIFYVNIPVGLFAFAGLWHAMTERDRSDKPFRALGFAFAALAAGAAQAAIDRGPALGWFASVEVCVEVALAVIGLMLALANTRFAAHPFIDRAMFADRRFGASLAFMFLIGLVALSSTTLISMLLQGPYAMSASAAGLLLAPRGIGVMIGNFVSPYWSERTSGVQVLVGSVLLVAAGTVGFAFAGASPLWLTVTGLVQGLGLGTAFVQANVAAFSGLPRELRSEASGVYSLGRGLGQSFGVSLVAASLPATLGEFNLDIYMMGAVALLPLVAVLFLRNAKP